MNEEQRAAAIEAMKVAICKSKSCMGWACCQWPAQAGTTCLAKHGNYDEAATAAFDAALRVMGEAGLVLAPEEETRRMTYAALDAQSVQEAIEGHPEPENLVSIIYRRMLAARPR